jgi:hypothetical protein
VWHVIDRFEAHNTEKKKKKERKKNRQNEKG